MTRHTMIWLYVGLGCLTLFFCAGLRTGVYKGSFRAHFSLADDTFLSLTAESPQHWYWSRPENHRYGEATLETQYAKGGDAVLNLPQHTMQVGEQRSELDAVNLTRFMAPHVKEEQEARIREQAQAILEILHGLRDGTAPGPRHHGHYLEAPVEAHIQHFTSGKNYAVYGLWIWMGIWPGILLVQRVGWPTHGLSPLSVYLGCFAAAVAVDATIIAVGMACPPGPVSETLELAFGLFNFPGWIVFGEWIGVTRDGLVFSAHCWATLPSMAWWSHREKPTP